MSAYYIFSDASYDPKSGSGVTAFLILSEEEWVNCNSNKSDLKIHTTKIDGENIARLEFLSAIEALHYWKTKYLKKKEETLTLIIDCKAIANLLDRRTRLEKNGFMSLRKGEILSNADLYKKFLALYDELCPEIFWVKGHSAKSIQTDFQRVFSLVDKHARQILRDNRA